MDDSWVDQPLEELRTAFCCPIFIPPAQESRNPNKWSRATVGERENPQEPRSKSAERQEKARKNRRRCNAPAERPVVDSVPPPKIRMIHNLEGGGEEGSLIDWQGRRRPQEKKETGSKRMQKASEKYASMVGFLLADAKAFSGERFSLEGEETRKNADSDYRTEVPRRGKDREQADGKIRRIHWPHDQKTPALSAQERFSAWKAEDDRAEKSTPIDCWVPRGGGAISEKQKKFGPGVEEKIVADSVPAEINSFRSRCMITDDHEGGEKYGYLNKKRQAMKIKRADSQ